jgi:hypothetical protein
MTAFTVILKTFLILSSAIGFFLEDGPTANSALLHSVLTGSRICGHSESKKSDVEMYKRDSIDLPYLSLLCIEVCSIYDSIYTFLNLQDIITDLSETFPLVEYCMYLQTI